MRIGIDGNEANIVNRVGVNVYAYQILKNLAKLQDESKTNHTITVYLKEKPLSDLPKETQNFKYKVIPGRGMWILTKLMPRLLLNPDKLDVFFSPSHYIPPISRVPRVFSIMDVGYLEFSEQFTKMVFWQLKWWSAISIIVSKRIIAISNATKRDIVRHYPFSKDKIHVTPLGFDSTLFNTTISDKDVRRVKDAYSIVDDYILFIGTLKPSKNIEGFIEAFSLVTSKFPKLQLVIAGKKGWLYDSIFKKAESLGISNKIVFTDYLPDRDKPALIKGAKVFVLPSFWEGFGIDILSAMGSGVPVVASDTGSIPEVVGDAGVLVDPKDPREIARGLIKVLSLTKTDYNKVIEKGLAQAKKFSWEECTRKTLEIIENAVRK